MNPKVPKVFVSCGQSTDGERDLGKRIASLITERTDAEGYFAENQSSLEGLTNHILKALDDCVGFIAVLHHRGEVVNEKKRHIRGSVWVEQELAIAAFLVQVHDRRLPVAVYIQKGIRREGIREQIIVQPVEFENHEQVLNDLRSRIDSGRFVLAPLNRPRPAHLVGALKFQTVKRSQNYHCYKLLVTVGNDQKSDSAAAGYWFELEFPSMALEANETHISEVRERATRTHRVFRWTGDKIGTPSLFPGDSKTVSLEYFVNNDLDDDGTIYTQYVTLTIGSADQPKVRIQKKFREISDF